MGYTNYIEQEYLADRFTAVELDQYIFRGMICQISPGVYKLTERGLLLIELMEQDWYRLTPSGKAQLAQTK